MGFLAEVGRVGLLAEAVPVAGEHALATRPFEGEPEPTDAAEQVDETEGGHLSPERRGRSIGGGAVGRGGFLGRRRRGDETLPSFRSVQTDQDGRKRKDYPPERHPQLQSVKSEDSHLLRTDTKIRPDEFYSGEPQHWHPTPQDSLHNNMPAIPANLLFHQPRKRQ